MYSSIEKIENEKGFNFENIWNLSKYIIENISNIIKSDNKLLLEMPVNNRIIDELLTAPILTEEGMIFKIFKS